MRRRRQCPAVPAALVGSQGWRCQRLVDHEGPHKASYSDRSTMHYSWEDCATSIFEYQTLPGTVRFRAPFWTPQRRYRTGEWTVSVLIALALWWVWSETAAAVFLVLELFTSIRRAHFVAVGRFTAGVYLVRRDNYPAFFAIGFARYGPEANAKRSGLQVVVGRLSLIVCALFPRDERADHQYRTAQREALWKDGTR
ncbi:hypothetical protein [Streptomyces sp. MBT33]|uniref:hypothetical protein n=1 Tax=Streptomyces sp. MBT33 TaxID=1488363 RepID=UPI00190D9BA1|nr:hypothetical protein [Streptomyces sp. MBT33]MBK3639517.1 hypothetical protein [Streptomyces sp. MBT33]